VKRKNVIGQQFVPLPRDLLRSDAWRSLGINERRLVDFLLLEHMRHGGQQNGNLKAPRQQLHAFGIGPRFVSAVIATTEERGLIQCKRGGMRVATTYALTWLPMADGTPASNGWRSHRDPNLRPMSEPKPRNLTNQGKSALVSQGKSDGRNLTNQGKSDGRQNLVSQGEHPYRQGEHPYRKGSYQDGAVYSVSQGDSPDAAPVVPFRPGPVGGTGR
jgi:hypothetical protein